MTLNLRRRHFQLLTILALVVTPLFLLGLFRRNSFPESEALPPELVTETQSFTSKGDARKDLFEGATIQVHLWELQETGSTAVSFTADRAFLKPDLLAYWSTAQPVKTDALPGDAILLGAFVAGPLVLPKEALSREGSLILFSMADGEIVDVSKPVRFAGAQN